MRKLLFIVSLLLPLVLSAGAREYIPLTSSQPVSLTDKLWKEKGNTTAAPCTYRSIDQHGDSLTLSGKIFVPKNGRAERIILCPHFTITANSECPSECWPSESFLAQKNYVVLMPDYIGYGLTAERVHPYLDARLAAQNSIDMLKAAVPFLLDNHLYPLEDSIYIVGFSQGAAVAIAALEMIEKTNLCAVKKCFASSGPYDVAVTYDLCVERNHVGMAFVVPSFVMGTDAAYDLHIHPDTIFTPWMLKRLDYVLSKDHSVLMTSLYLGKGKLSKYLSPAGMDKSKGEKKRLYEGYLRSSLVHIYIGDTVFSDWCPKTPIYLMHSTNDDLVNYECGDNLRTMFIHNGAKNVEYDFGKYGGHIRSMIRFFRKLNDLL